MAFTHLTVNTGHNNEGNKKFEIHFEEFRSQLTILYVMVFEFILKFFLVTHVSVLIFQIQMHCYRKNVAKVDKVDCRSVSTCVTIFRVIWVYARSLKYKDTEKITKNRRMFLFAIMQNTFTKIPFSRFLSRIIICTNWN